MGGRKVEEKQHRVALDPVQDGILEISGNYKEEKEKEKA